MRIALGVTGCIASYKAAEIVRALVRRNVEVDVIMTQHATSFISPLTFQTLSRKRVIVEQYELHSDASVEHIALARLVDLFLVAPASADVINKFASGIADDFLTTFFLSCTAPVMIAPSMNASMYLNPVVQESVEKLKRGGVHIIAPEKGDLACGEEGVGRLPDIEKIVEEAMRAAVKSNSLKGKNVLVTAGGTREPIDGVRYISNRSSGKMGYAVAEAARKRGADVTLVSGPTDLTVPWGINLIEVETSDEMADTVLKEATRADYIFMAAAVSDFKPEKVHKGKIKKSEGDLTLKLNRTRDILLELGKKKEGRREASEGKERGERGEIRKSVGILVGFAAETENLLRNAKSKLREKNLDFIVANDVRKKGTGFGSDRNAAILVDRKGKRKVFSRMYKRELAERLLDAICKPH
ncbi:MAG: bifunctional phosphopantothenoylcysteine decarboxylase/phosphopantothenate--cysteine ligase CoaBC [Acidobacteriota bacterium]